MPPSVCFILGEMGPSGGAGAVTRHAAGLATDHGHEVAIALWAAPGEALTPPAGVELVSVADARARDFDVAVATWWRTAYDLFGIPARRHAYFVQQFEQRTYRPGDVERFGAAATHALPVAFLTEARWIAEELAQLRPDASCFHVPNGIDKGRFRVEDKPACEGPLRVLVEGSPGLWFKGVQDAAAVLDLAREPIATTLVTPERVSPETCARFDEVVGPLDRAAMADAYRAADVLLKLSRVEGVFTPPLEAFHCGVPCVVWPVTGHDEFVRHRVNGAVVDFDDHVGTAAWIDMLARDRGLLEQLREGALETAVEWPSWKQSTARFAAALAEIDDGEAPASGAGGPRLLADLDFAMEEQRAAQRREMRATQLAEMQLAQTRAALTAIELTRTWRYTAPFRRLGRAARRRLLGR